MEAKEVVISHLADQMVKLFSSSRPLNSQVQVPARYEFNDLSLLLYNNCSYLALSDRRSIRVADGVSCSVAAHGILAGRYHMHMSYLFI